MACMHLISTWTYPLPSCMYGMHASYLLMDIPTTTMYIRYACILSPHASNLHMDIPPTPICMAYMHLISRWTYPLPSYIYGMHASYLLIDIPTTIMYVWYACILSPHGHTYYHHVREACMHLISTWTYSPPSCRYGM